jgi:hypothetical protein
MVNKIITSVNISFQCCSALVGQVVIDGREVTGGRVVVMVVVVVIRNVKTHIRLSIRI